MKEQFFIRLVDINDDRTVSEAATVINQAFLKQVVARTDRPTITAEEIKQQLHEGTKEGFIIATGSNQIVGAALLTIEPTYVYIWCVSVAPAYQGQGLGIKLMSYMEARALNVHKKKLAILSSVYHPLEKQEHLIRWYQLQGYCFSHDQLPSDLTAIWKPEFHR